MTKLLVVQVVAWGVAGTLLFALWYVFIGCIREFRGEPLSQAVLGAILLWMSVACVALGFMVPIILADVTRP